MKVSIFIFKGLAVTGKGPVIATDLNFLRFFSFSGVQTFVKCLNGPIITMVGSTQHLFVVYESGAPYNSNSFIN